MTTSKFLLLDANVVIAAYEGKIWQVLLNSFFIALPSVVFHDEARYFTSQKTGYVPIELEPLSASSKIKIFDATTSQIASIKSMLSNDFFNSIDPGELEAMAILNSGDYDDYKFCSGDFAANKAMGVLDMASYCISLEDVLAQIGTSTKLKPHFSTSTLKRALLQAKVEKSLHRK
jgi:hypothetical protein